MPVLLRDMLKNKRVLDPSMPCDYNQRLCGIQGSIQVPSCWG
jgi:hypothetical protein